MIINMGLAKDTKGAQTVLLVILVAVIVIGFSAPLILGGGGVGVQGPIPEGTSETVPG